MTDKSASSSGVALVTGATGLVGRYLVMHLTELGSWKVYAMSRKDKLQYEEMPDGLPQDRVTAVKVDSLLDSKAVRSGLSSSPLSDVTHIFHCAYMTAGADQYKDSVDNLAALRNVVDAVEEAQSKSQDKKLVHVYVQAGAKWYGQHLGKYKTPGKETDPRYMTPNFYYDMVDYCQDKVKAGATWSCSSLLPNPVIGYSPSSYMNLLNLIAGYAIICREQGLPFRFPGSDLCYNALMECCDVRLLCEAAVFVATTPACANQIFNVSNGDVYRWNEVWPEIARHCGLEVAPPQAISMQTTMTTQDKLTAWQNLLSRHNLKDNPVSTAYDKLFQWPFMDFNFKMESDFFQSVQKLRKAGFNSMKLDTADMYKDWLRELDTLGVFPPIAGGSADGVATAGGDVPHHDGVGTSQKSHSASAKTQGVADAPAGDLASHRVC